MAWFNSLSISASGLSAEQLRMDVISNNIANAQTTRTSTGGPYRREMVVFQPNQPVVNRPFSDWMNMGSGSAVQSQGGGVRVAGIIPDQSPFKLVYNPSSPDAVNGYVQMPNVNISTEMVDMISASRAYEANVTAFDTGKQMAVDALTLGK